MVRKILQVASHQQDMIDFGIFTLNVGGNWVGEFFRILLSLGAFLALLVIIINSVQLMVSGHDPQKVSKALQNIQMAVLGLIVVLTAAGFIYFITNRLI